MNRTEFLRKIAKLQVREFRKDLFITNGFPKKFIDWTWDDITQAKNIFYDFIFQYIDKFPDSGGLYLYSPMQGIGKTVISCIIARTLMELRKIRRKAIYINLPSIAFSLREGSEDFYEIFHELSYADLIIIDDIGKEYSSEWLTNFIRAIIDTRYISGLPIIITSNFNTDVVVERMVGEDIIKDDINSRITEMTKEIDMKKYFKVKDSRIIQEQ